MGNLQYNQLFASGENARRENTEGSLQYPPVEFRVQFRVTRLSQACSQTSERGGGA